MFENVQKVISETLMAIRSAMKEHTTHHHMRGSKARKQHKQRLSAKYSHAHQNHREITRRQRQVERCQLDFTASGQPDIKGRKRLLREAAQL